MSATSSSRQKKNKNKSNTTGNKAEEATSSVTKLLAALQIAQNKSGGAATASNPSSTKKVNATVNYTNNKKTTKTTTEQQSSSQKTQKPKKENKPKGSVASRMQQHVAEQQETQSKRPRNPSTSKQTNMPNSKLKIPTDVLDSLEFRFISNIPDIDKKNIIRVCFQVELAHWFYIDHIVDSGERKDCPIAGIRDFTKLLFSHCKELKRYANNVDEVISQWREYKSTVPTYGSILIDESLEHVLLVQSYFAKGNSWGFPKGKVNQNEHPRDCAIRETNEETGFDFGTISKNEKRVQKFINDAMVRLYIVPNVPKSFPFEPQTRKEIRKIQWFKISDLPTGRDDDLPEYLAGHKFYMVMPFVSDIQRFVGKEMEKKAKSPTKSVEQQEVPTIFSQLFSNIQNTNLPSSSSINQGGSIFKRMTSEELFSSFKKNEDSIARPTLPEISPSVGGIDALATLGLCTPLKPGENLNNFPPTLAMPSEQCPLVVEENFDEPEKVKFRRELFGTEIPKETKENESYQPPVVGFEMPKTLQEPVVTSSHPWQQHKRTQSTDEKSVENYQGWLGSQLVNSIMHSSLELNESSPLSGASNTPTNRSLSHLISKPIQPQPIIPLAATPTALGSAEAPKKSSRISLSDNSAFTAIGTGVKIVGSTPKSTQAPRLDNEHSIFGNTLTDSINIENVPIDRESKVTSRNEKRQAGPIMTSSAKYPKDLFASIVSPVSSELRSIHGGSTSSIQELSLINKNIWASGISIYKPIFGILPESEKWKIPLKININKVLQPTSEWENAFRTNRN